MITSDNLIEKIDKIGPWSIYALASIALKHYFPDEYDEDDYCPTGREVILLNKLELKTWDEVVIKYQKEIGYNAPEGFDLDFINEY